MANQELMAAIRTTFTKSRGTYGAPRIHAELKSTGTPCSLNRVARLMRNADIKARRRRTYKVTTTNSRHNYPVAPNTLNRQFWATRPNEKWVGDITYIPIYQPGKGGSTWQPYSISTLVRWWGGLWISTWNKNWLPQPCRWPPLNGGLARECCIIQTEEANTPHATTSNCLMLTRCR